MKRLFADQRGNVTIMAALMIPGLLGFGAITADLSFRYVIRGELQASADAAALAASQKLPDTTAATAAALDIAAKNVPSSYGSVVQASDIVFGTYDTDTQTFTAGGASPTAVQVTAGRTSSKNNAPPMFFASALGIANSGVQASSTAYRPPPPYCVYVLNSGNANGAFSAGGGGEFSVPNCGVWINSSHSSKAGSESGSSKVTAKSFCIVGGYSGSFTATPKTGCAVAADPLASLPEYPNPGGPCKDGSVSPWFPGRYCGNITVPANLTINPGPYFFEGATIDVSAGQNITGQGVFLFLDANSSLTHTNGGSLSITAPSSGTYKGVALFQSRSASTNNLIKLTGNSNFVFDGTIYLPKAQLSMAGNSTVSVVSKTGYIIAYELHYTGASTFTVGTWGGASRTLSPPTSAGWYPPSLVQ
jgi:Flp pilus assembly protein TadG